MKKRNIIDSPTEPGKEDIWFNKGVLKYFSSKGWINLVSSSLNGDEVTANVYGLTDVQDSIVSDLYNKLDVVRLQIGNSDNVKADNLAVLPNGFFFTQLDYGFGTGTFTPSVGGFANIVTAYGHESFYQINADGSITRDSAFIKPNDPVTVTIDVTQIGTELDEYTISAIKMCAEVLVTTDTFIIKYSRVADNDTDDIYFVAPSKNIAQRDLLVFKADSNKLETVIEYNN